MRYLLYLNKQPLDLSSIEYFKDKQMDNILNIIHFTQQFFNKDELINYLLDKSIIGSIPDNSLLDISYSGNLNSLLPMNVFYSDSKDYFDSDFVLEYFLCHIYDMDFMSSFYQYFNKVKTSKHLDMLHKNLLRDDLSDNELKEVADIYILELLYGEDVDTNLNLYYLANFMFGYENNHHLASKYVI